MNLHELINHTQLFNYEKMNKNVIRMKKNDVVAKHHSPFTAKRGKRGPNEAIVEVGHAKVSNVQPWTEVHESLGKTTESALGVWHLKRHECSVVSPRRISFSVP